MKIRSSRAAVTAVIVALGTVPLRAQTLSPPIDGVTGTVAVDGVVQKEYRAANIVIVKALDAFQFAKGLFAHRKDGTDPMAALEEGTMVAIHYEGLAMSEGRLIRIDRGRREITLGFVNGRTETFRLAREATTIALYYENESGQKVAHYFRKIG